MVDLHYCRKKKEEVIEKRYANIVHQFILWVILDRYKRLRAKKSGFEDVLKVLKLFKKLKVPSYSPPTSSSSNSEYSKLNCYFTITYSRSRPLQILRYDIFSALIPLI